MLDVKLKDDAVCIGKHFSVSLQRTLRIPDDGRTYPLPPGLGRFPVCRVADYEDRVPAAWNTHGGIFIPMYQREALWLDFNGAHWRPNAVKVAVGKVNAISGKRWRGGLNRSGRHQNYVVCPDQPWLDGINAGDGFIRQFVAMPLGMGYTVEGQITGEETFGGIQIEVFDPKPGRFPERPPAPRFEREMGLMCCSAPDMGLGAGGRMRQKIYPDEHGVDTWDQENTGRVYVHIVNSTGFREITGQEPPSTPVTARSYTQCGLPWFELYDEGKGDLDPSKPLVGIKSIKEMDKEKGFAPQQDDTGVEVPDEQLAHLQTGVAIKDGNWS